MKHIFSIALALFMTTAVIAPGAMASTSYTGKLLIGTAELGIGCGNNIPCEPTDAAGYDGVSFVSVDLQADAPGQPFTLSGVDGAETGLVDLRIEFYDAAGDYMERVDEEFFAPESGTVPAGAATARVWLWAGADVTFTLTIG